MLTILSRAETNASELSKLVEETKRRRQASDMNETSIVSALIDCSFKQLNWLSDEEKEQLRWIVQ